MMVRIHTNARDAMATRSQAASARLLIAPARFLRARNAAIMRLLILALLALLLVFVGLLLATGRMDIGVPVIAGVLFTGFAAAQIGRARGDV